VTGCKGVLKFGVPSLESVPVVGVLAGPYFQETVTRRCGPATETGLCAGCVQESTVVISLENRDSKSFAELLAEETGRPVEEFELTEDMEFPDPDERERVPAEEFYDEE